ncbi:MULTISPECIES: hypothetical protein [Okeania]|uniref:Uncharacterized protein n=1 Tax=Okeania hirsuta TaxID=1458930 RepID=A0A3N6NNB4_9CYAN|nr:MULTISPECIES: hypothetical protein [Okeania]NET11775.1 hypothetical protein [Okeania sp. SIO1H6]NES74375.1 hypothetical protein [Okeania sp. SIO1H4]NES88615.1 hypothetical protein [Okeania sp. SIO2B9]NET18397.1 hypothetical protein [Okeania sp. SIO1H5]NET80181.1 hypothetical protein [Okeania sp. SIO1F9]
MEGSYKTYPLLYQERRKSVNEFEELIIMQTRSRNPKNFANQQKAIIGATHKNQLVHTTKKTIVKQAFQALWKKKGHNVPRQKPFAFLQDSRGIWYYEGRPAFTQRTRDDIPVKVGDHRRHIIPSHLLLDAFTAYINDNPKTIETDVDTFINNKGIKYRGNTLGDKLRAVSTYLQNNQKNLFPESGGQNIAIGFLPKDLRDVLTHCDNYFKSNKHLATVNDDTISEMKTKVGALKQKRYPTQDANDAKKEIIDVLLPLINDMSGDDYEDIKSLFKDSIIPSMELDLNKSEDMKNQNEKVIEIMGDLYKVENHGGLDFFQIMEDFLNLPQN